MEQLTNDGDYYLFNFYINTIMENFEIKIFFNDGKFESDVSELHKLSGNFLQTLASKNFIESLYLRLKEEYMDSLNNTTDEESKEYYEKVLEFLEYDYKKTIDKLK